MSVGWVSLQLGQSVNRAAQSSMVGKEAVRFSWSVMIHSVLAAFFHGSDRGPGRKQLRKDLFCHGLRGYT